VGLRGGTVAEECQHPTRQWNPQQDSLHIGCVLNTGITACCMHIFLQACCWCCSKSAQTRPWACGWMDGQEGHEIAAFAGKAPGWGSTQDHQVSQLLHNNCTTLSEWLIENAWHEF